MHKYVQTYRNTHIITYGDKVKTSRANSMISKERPRRRTYISWRHTYITWRQTYVRNEGNNMIRIN